MKIDNLRDLYISELKDIYSAEKQIVDALPKMANAATHVGLKAAFNQHLEETRTHVQRIEHIFQGLDASPRGKRCEGVEGLLKEGEEFIKNKDIDDDARDAALIAAAQRVEHYEIATYGTVRTYAQMLGDDQAARVLQQTLNEEGDADRHLTELAVNAINLEAVS